MHIPSSTRLAIFFLGNEEKLVVLLVYSSLPRVATNGIRNSSIAISSISWIKQAVLKWGLETKSFRNHHSTKVRRSQNSMNDVTRLVPTENLRNKDSLRESILLQTGQATYSSSFNQSTYIKL